MLKKVLIITYYWPPAGGPGVQRWMKFATYLPDYHIKPIVYTPSNAHYPMSDESLCDEIPRGVDVIRKPIFEPYRLASFLSKSKTKRISSGIIATSNSYIEKLMLWIRGNIFIPDARKYWIKPSIKYLSEYIKTEEIDTIITTGPPHSLHLIGEGLKRKNDICWIADFRDPWTTIAYHRRLRLTRNSSRKHLRLETKVLHNADKVIVTSPSTQKEFLSKTDTPVVLITNGFSHPYFEQQQSLSEKFTLTHSGSLLSERNPKALWRALKEIIETDVSFAKAFELRLAGTISHDVLEGLEKYGLKKYLKIYGYLSHSGSIKLLKSSQVLLLTEIDSIYSVGTVPGKLFEYLASLRPILAIGPKNWDVNEILSETQGGVCHTYQDSKKIKETIIEFYSQYQNNRLKSASIDIQKYHRSHLTKRLAAEILNTNSGNHN